MLAKIASSKENEMLRNVANCKLCEKWGNPTVLLRLPRGHGAVDRRQRHRGRRQTRLG